MKASLFKTGGLALCASLLIAGCSSSPTQPMSNMKTVQLNSVSTNGIGASVGTVTLQDSPVGLIIQTNLTNLPMGPHGFHVHEKGSCEPAEKDGKWWPRWQRADITIQLKSSIMARRHFRCIILKIRQEAKQPHF